MTCSRSLLAFGLLFLVASASAQTNLLGGLASLSTPGATVDSSGISVKDEGVTFNADGSVTVVAHGVPLFQIPGLTLPVNGPIPAPVPPPAPGVSPAPAPKLPPVPPVVIPPQVAQGPTTKAEDIAAILTDVPGAIAGLTSLGRKMKL